MTRITRILPVLTFVIAVVALVLALWPVVGDAPWEPDVARFRLHNMDATAYSERGLSYYKVGEYHHAINDFTEAIRLQP